MRIAAHVSARKHVGSAGGKLRAAVRLPTVRLLVGDNRPRRLPEGEGTDPGVPSIEQRGRAPVVRLAVAVLGGGPPLNEV